MNIANRAKQDIKTALFIKLFMIEAKAFAIKHDDFDAYEAINQVFENKDIMNDIKTATLEEIPNVVEFASDHYIW